MSETEYGKRFLKVAAADWSIGATGSPSKKMNGDISRSCANMLQIWEVTSTHGNKFERAV